MKKIKCIPAVLLALGLIGFSTSGYSQSHTSGETTPVRVGSTILNLGIGVGADYRHSYGTGFGFKAAAEFGLWQAGPGVITLGPEIGGSFSNGGYYDDFRASTMVIAARAAWHSACAEVIVVSSVGK